MTIKLFYRVNIANSSFYVSNYPYYLVYIKEPYKNIKILIPDDYVIDAYHVYGRYDTSIKKY